MADNTSSTRDSLGKLSLNDVDLTPTLVSPRAKAPNQDNCNLSKQLPKQRQLAEGVLSGQPGLPSMYLRSMAKREKKPPMASESTIDDSDFLSNIPARSSFNPNDISTPRSSTASVEHEGSISSGLNIAGNSSLLADQIKHSDTSIKDLSKQYGSLRNDVFASIRNVSLCGNARCGSPTSLDLFDGGLPIESTKVELDWASVKGGKSSSKDFVLRNKMNQTIQFQIMVSGSCFKIIKPEGESQLPLSVLLHPLESRSFTVLFTPTSTGAYTERLIFQPITTTSTQDKPYQRILLFGYGGHISPTIRNLLRVSTSKYWLPLGNIDEIRDTITKKFTITNSGTLAAFVDVTVTLKYLLLFTGLTISPNMAILPVGASQHFQVKYIPNKDDFRRLKYGELFKSHVCEVAVIKCVFGTEILRARIRRLVGKLDRHDSPTDPFITRIIESFPRENIPNDIQLITESVSSLTYLIQHLEYKEIIVSIEHDIDETLVPSPNDSTLFQPLCFDTSDVSCIKQNPDMFSVDPKSIVLCPGIKNSDIVFCVNNSDKVICYEAHSSSNLVNVVPRSGNVLPHKHSIITISCKDNINPYKNDCLKLSIYTDNSCIEIDVKITSLNVPS